MDQAPADAAGPVPADAVGPARLGGSVLLAEHEAPVAHMVARYLSRDGLAVRQVPTPELALGALADRLDSVAVLDLTMPGLDPRRIRQTLRTPVVFLAAPGPRPWGLSGGNGSGRVRRWLTRPFGPRLLVATVRELLRAVGQEQARGVPGGPSPRYENGPETPATIAVAGLTLARDRQIAVVGERNVPLTGTEFGILAALLASPGRALSRRQLLTAAGRKSDERAADVYIAQLRAKLGVPGLIRTVRGAGYAIDESRWPQI